MNPTRTTSPSHASAVTTSRPRRPGHPASVPPAGAGAAAATGQATTGTAAAPVERLEGIRVRLAALAPLLRDEPARRLAEVVREVEALVEELDRQRTSGSQETGSPRPSVPSPPVPSPAVPSQAVPSQAVPSRGLPSQGAGIHEVPAAGHPRQSPSAATPRHRPPALPCGPDYPLLPAHRAS